MSFIPAHNMALSCFGLDIVHSPDAHSLQKYFIDASAKLKFLAKRPAFFNLILGLITNELTN